jgi:hypothetical protein
MLVILGAMSASMGFALALQEPARCEPSDCLKAISAKAAVVVAEVDEAAVVGHWTHGPGLGGWELYVFADHTYVHSEWGDIFPEVIVDKGKWSLARGLLTLSPDADITWRQISDRRFLIVKEVDRLDNLLLGLDRTMDVHQEMVKKEPAYAQGYLRAASMKKERNWKPSTANRFKADLLKRCWRPDFFGK